MNKVQINQLKAYLDHSYINNQVFVESDEDLVDICRAATSLRLLPQGCRAACNRCGRMRRRICQAFGMNICSGCLTRAKKLEKYAIEGHEA